MNNLKALIQSLNLNKLDAAIIESPYNRRYFLGFKSSAGVLFVTKQKAYFLIDFRYYEKASSLLVDPRIEVVLLEKMSEQLNELIKKHEIKEVAIESEFMSVFKANEYRKKLSNSKLITDSRLNDMINFLRITKNPVEIELIKKAQDITDRTFSYLLSYIEKGRTEKEIALAAELFMRKNGSEGVAFDIIAVSGKNSSLPHGEPTDKKLEKGDFLTIDMGSVFGGYCSDMTRTVTLGHFDEEQELVYNTVLLAQISALNSIKEGVTGSFVDKVARDIIINAGFGGTFGHGLGHGVGVEIHETPRLAPGYDFDLKAGMVVTVEPGIYIKDCFGVRIEDLIVVTKDGIENLTKSSKELIVL